MAGPRSHLDARLGRTQGAIAPSGWTPPEGAKALVLGSDVPGSRELVADGDFRMAEQSFDLTSVGLIRFRAHLRPSASAGVGWFLEALLGRGARMTFRIGGRELDRVDGALPTAHLVSETLVGFRLYASAVATGEVELPGAYVDAVSIEPMSDSFQIVNRNPEPNEVDAPVDSSVRFEVTDLSGANRATSISIRVLVEGVMAFDAGSPQNGWSESSSLFDSNATIRVNLTPPTPFESNQVVNVRILVFLDGEFRTAADYSFTIEDASAPIVVSAQAIEERKVRVRFSESVLRGDGTAPGDALDPALYSVELLSTSLDDGLPAISIEPSSVLAAPNPAEVDVVVDVEMTRGARYRVFATGVSDLAGNVTASPTDFADFLGYACPSPPERRFEIEEFVPDLNLAEDDRQDLRKFLACFQEVIDLLLCDVDRFYEILDADLADERFVDIALADNGNPFLFADLTLSEKRNLVRALVPLYKKKGTDAGIIEAIRLFLDLIVTISVPAFDGIWELGTSLLGQDTLLGTSDPATLYTFVIHCPTLTTSQRERILALADYAKAAHTHFRLEEPAPPPVDPDHWQLSASLLGTETSLH